MTQDDSTQLTQGGNGNGRGPMRFVTFLFIAILLAALFAGAVLVVQLVSGPDPTPTLQPTLRPTFTPSAVAVEPTQPPDPTQPGVSPTPGESPDATATAPLTDEPSTAEPTPGTVAPPSDTPRGSAFRDNS